MKVLKVALIAMLVAGALLGVLYVSHLIMTNNPSGEGTDIFPQRYECYDLEKGDCCDVPQNQIIS